MTAQNPELSYSVLSPWGEADPVPMRGLIADRPEDLNNNRIGLYYMWKRASKPILESLMKKISERYPKAEFSWYEESQMNTPEIESKNKGKYEKWLKTVDTVIYTYGD